MWSSLIQFALSFLFLNHFTSPLSFSKLNSTAGPLHHNSTWQGHYPYRRPVGETLCPIFVCLFQAKMLLISSVLCIYLMNHPTKNQGILTILWRPAFFAFVEEFPKNTKDTNTNTNEQHPSWKKIKSQTG